MFMKNKSGDPNEDFFKTNKQTKAKAVTRCWRNKTKFPYNRNASLDGYLALASLLSKTHAFLEQ